MKTKKTIVAALRRLIGHMEEPTTVPPTEDRISTRFFRAWCETAELDLAEIARCADMPVEVIKDIHAGNLPTQKEARQIAAIMEHPRYVEHVANDRQVAA